MQRQATVHADGLVGQRVVRAGATDANLTPNAEVSGTGRVGASHTDDEKKGVDE